MIHSANTTRPRSITNAAIGPASMMVLVERVTFVCPFDDFPRNIPVQVRPTVLGKTQRAFVSTNALSMTRSTLVVVLVNIVKTVHIHEPSLSPSRLSPKAQSIPN